MSTLTLKSVNNPKAGQFYCPLCGLWHIRQVQGQISWDEKDNRKSTFCARELHFPRNWFYAHGTFKNYLRGQL